MELLLQEELEVIVHAFHYLLMAVEHDELYFDVVVVVDGLRMLVMPVVPVTLEIVVTVCLLIHLHLAMMYF